MNKILSLILSILTLLANNACKDKTEIPAPDPQADNTYIGCTIAFPKVINSRAAGSSDPNANTFESAFQTVAIFIFDAPTGRPTTNQQLNVNDFNTVTADDGTIQWRTNDDVKIPTSAGEKYILAGLNLNDTLFAKLRKLTLDDFLYQAQTLTLQQLVNPDAGLVMFSSEPKSCTFENDPNAPANNPTVTVVRLVAKITVEERAGGVEQSGDGILSDLQFDVANANTKMFLCPMGDFKDPNWTADSYNPDDFEVIAGDFKPINSYNAPIEDRYAVYAAENSSESHAQKEVTRVVIRGKFLPNTVVQFANGVDATDGFVENKNHGVTTPRTFWVVTDQIGFQWFFFNEYAATLFQSGKAAATKATFEDGYCYFNIFLNPQGFFNQVADPDRIYDIYRNDYYRCVINKILALGKPVPDITDPDLPPVPDDELEATLEITQWTSIVEQYELEP